MLKPLAFQCLFALLKYIQITILICLAKTKMKSTFASLAILATAAFASEQYREDTFGRRFNHFGYGGYNSGFKTPYDHINRGDHYSYGSGHSSGTIHRPSNPSPWSRSSSSSYYRKPESRPKPQPKPKKLVKIFKASDALYGAEFAMCELQNSDANGVILLMQ